MPKVKVYNLSRRGVGEMELSDAVFNAKVNESLFYDVLKAQLAGHRRGSAASKNRAEVSATSRKLYRQKGTGNARHGSKRAPIFVGGGAAHGPRPRSFAYRPPRKMRLGALRGALTLKLQEGRLLVVQDFELKEIKTRKLAEVLQKLKVVDSALIVDANDNEKLRLSARNLQNYSVLPPEGVNLYDLLRHEHLVLTQGAVEALESRCRPNGARSGAAGPRVATAPKAAAPKAMTAPEPESAPESEAGPASAPETETGSAPETGSASAPETETGSASAPESVSESASEPVSASETETAPETETASAPTSKKRRGTPPQKDGQET